MGVITIKMGVITIKMGVITIPFIKYCTAIITILNKRYCNENS